MNFKLSLLALLGAEALANALALAPSPSLNTPAVVSTSSAESVALAKLFPASRVNETRIFTAAAAAVAGNSGFQASCRDIRMNSDPDWNDELLACCADGSGQWQLTSTLLTICIVNIDGGMGWGDFGYFADTCYGCTVLNADSNNPLLSCKCKTKIGNYAIALLDLSNGVGNRNGALICGPWENAYGYYGAC